MTKPAKKTTPMRAPAKSGMPWKIVCALLLLRLCLGWHFFREGTKKLSYDADDGGVEVAFSAEGFFKTAKGPLAGLFKSQVPGGHRWYELLPIAKELKPLTEDQRYARTDWIEAYNRIKPGTPHEVELFPDLVPYQKWGKQIESDRRETLTKFTDIRALTDEQKSAAADIFQMRLQQLSDYLAGEWEVIEQYQHELWQLEQKQSKPVFREVPFEQDRLQKLASDTERKPLTWVRAVGQFDELFATDLRNLVTSEQLESNSGLADRVDRALAKPRQRRMDWMSLAVTCLIIGVGVCLLLGIFTRLAALGGALFLLSVMATQPPWVAGANTLFFYYQLVEFAAFVALAAGVAQHTPSLDYVFRGLWCRCCGAKGAKS